LNPSEGTIIL